MALSFFAFPDFEAGGGNRSLSHLSGEFSDKTPWVIGIASGFPKFWHLYTSTDQGATFVDQGAIPPSFNSGLGFVYQTGDTIHFAVGNTGASVQVFYYQIVWNPGTKTFTVPITSTFPGTFGISVPDIQMGQEPGGRLWAVVRFRSDATNNDFEAYFSDDSGASWTFSTVIATGGGGTGIGSPSKRAGIAVLEKKTIIGWIDSNATAGFKTRERAHTDPTGTWASEINRNAFAQGRELTGVALAPAPPLTKDYCWVYSDQVISPTAPKIYLTKVNEDGVGALTYASHTVYTKALFGGGENLPAVTGFDDGYRIYTADKSATPNDDLREFTTVKLASSVPSSAIIENLGFNENEGIGAAGTFPGRPFASGTSARLLTFFNSAGAGNVTIGSEGLSLPQPGGAGGASGEALRESIERGTQIKNPFGGRMRRNACMCIGKCNCS